MSLLDQMQPGQVWEPGLLAHMLPGEAPDPVVSALAGIPVEMGIAFVPVPGPRGLPGEVAGSLPWAQITDKPPMSFTQAFVNTDTVVVSHGLGRYPSVVVLDSAGTEWESEVVYNGSNQLTVRFSFTFSGLVTCN